MRITDVLLITRQSTNTISCKRNNLAVQWKISTRSFLRILQFHGFDTVVVVVANQQNVFAVKTQTTGFVEASAIGRPAVAGISANVTSRHGLQGAVGPCVPILSETFCLFKLV